MKKEYELANEKYVYVSSHVVTDDMGKKGKYKLPCMDMLYFNEFRKKCKNKKTETFEQRPEARQSRDISLPGGTVCPIGKRVCNIPEGRACFKYSRL